MRQQQISFPLVMVSGSAEQTRPVCAVKSKARFSKFHLQRFIQNAGLLLAILVMSVGSYSIIGHYFLKSVQVVGNSMVPTLQPNSHYLLNVWAFRNRQPQHNDIVVIRDPGDHGLSVKRVIAVAGESVHFKNGKVYVNGQQLNEPYLLPHTHTFTYSQAKEQFITCGKDQYFVLGDNRLVSIDSRSYGPVSRPDVLGLVEKN